MLILLVPTIIVLLLIFSIISFIRRSLIAGAIFLIAALLINIHTETYPLHLSYFTNSISHQKKDDQQIRILTYNIKYNSDYLRHNKDSLNSIMQFFKQQNADILILPESRLKSTSKTLFNQLDEIYPYSICSDYSGKDFYIETFVFSRYTINNARQYGQHYIYEMTVNLPSEKTAKLIACHLESNQSNSSLNRGEGILGNIRNGYNQRARESQMICDSLKDYHGPIIIAGDFNDISGSESLNLLQDNLELNDAWWNSGFGYGTTSISKNLYFRLDHILYSNHFKTTLIDIPNVNFSDHYPIITELQLQ